MRQRRSKPADLREACIAEATRIIEKQGVEALSLREVARRLGVSHQAPYKHFASRDHILAEVVRRAYADFAAHIDARTRKADPFEDLGELGAVYLDYARRHPLHYRLMFATALPDAREHPDMMLQAEHAFAELRAAIARLGAAAADQHDFDALFAWAAVHGLASILQSPAGGRLGFRHATLQAAPQQLLQRIGDAMRAHRARGSALPGTT